LQSNTTASNNTAVGTSALQLNTTGANNVAVGSAALTSNTTASFNTAVGKDALANNTTGSENTAIGYNALDANTTGSNNTATGSGALGANETSANNTAYGYATLIANVSGGSNTAIGYNAGYGSSTNGNVSGDNNTFIGNNSVGTSNSVSNVITLGNGSISTLRCQVTSITSLSDERDKKDIVNLSAGLEFLNKLRPVSFIWNTRDKAKVDIEDNGFIAQELISVQEETGITIPNLINADNPDKLEAAYGTLLPVLVKAIQELSAKVTALEAG